MKALFLTTAAAALILATPAAFAQDKEHGGGAHGGAAHATHAGASHGPSHAAPAMHGSSHAAPAMHSSHAAPAVHSATHGTMSHGGTAHTSTLRPSVGHRPVDSRVHTGAMPVTHATAASVRNTRHNAHGSASGHGSVKNFSRRNVTASRHYHRNAYRGPSGYSYRRWSYGETLPSVYFAQNYWISDYSDYGLQPPPYGTVWVQYGDDALLIDQSSGEILETVYGQFD